MRSSCGLDISNNFPLYSLVPPSLSTGTEIVLRPGRENDLVLSVNIAVGKSKGEGGRSTDNMSVRGVLRSVARALELVGSRRPWDNATQMSADCSWRGVWSTW